MDLKECKHRINFYFTRELDLKDGSAGWPDFRFRLILNVSQEWPELLGYFGFVSEIWSSCETLRQRVGDNLRHRVTRFATFITISGGIKISLVTLTSDIVNNFSEDQVESQWEITVRIRAWTREFLKGNFKKMSAFWCNVQKSKELIVKM